MPEKYGLWPGVVAIVADVEMYCVPCAAMVYGISSMQMVVDGVPGWQGLVDYAGNSFGVVLYGSEDVHTMYCGRCLERLCDEECRCYQPGQAECWQQYGRFLERR